MTMHQRGDLTRDSQLIYLSQWLGEFSEVEKDDFLQGLLDLYAPGQVAIGQRLAPLKSEDKKATLFDCRIDLFKQWFASWEPADREECLTRLKEADAEFMERFQKSKETPNEDKIVEEFWLRLDKGSSENYGNASIIENGSIKSQENGTTERQENGTTECQENGTTERQENGTTECQEDGTGGIRVNESVTFEQNGYAMLNGDAPSLENENPPVHNDEGREPDSLIRENGTASSADEVSENLIQNVPDPGHNEERSEIAAALDLATAPPHESTGIECQEEEAQAVKVTDEAGLGNES